VWCKKKSLVADDIRESREPMNDFKDLLGSCVFIHIFAFAIFLLLFFLDSDRLLVSSSTLSAAEPKQRVKGLIHGRFCVLLLFFALYVIFIATAFDSMMIKANAF
jgi:hypothetical protein